MRYLELSHLNNGFGLCYARNLGLRFASSNLITYLDDDNTIASTFVETVQQLFQQHPSIQCSMVQQWRRRDLVEGDRLVRAGVPFISPSAEVIVQDLLIQRELFDSNGFVHRRQSSLQWNPQHRIFADYEFLLQCLSLWGQDSFRLLPAVLVNYVQRSDGIIGQSSYGEWAEELRQILNRTAIYPVLADQMQQQLQQLVQHWQDKASRHRRIAAFSG